ncbi:MAG: hypothetical protein WAW80_03990 [Candidatus Saccharimonadales bacterium]
MGLLKLLTGSDSVKFPRFMFTGKITRRELIQRESEIGGHLFGQIPIGHHRQFFNLDRTTWVWYEEWRDEDGEMQNTTTRYEIHKNGVLKVQEGTPYYYIEGQELDNFVTATRTYYDRVTHDIYRRDPSTGQPLAV